MTAGRLELPAMASARQATSAQRERTERDVLTLVFDIHINKKVGL